MDETKTSCDNVATEKIKAFEPHIIVNKNNIEPCYSIMYYDTTDKNWHIGFSSYNLSFVRKWLKEEFEVVDVEFEEVKHGKWIDDGDCFHCSLCNKTYLLGALQTIYDVKRYWRYCANCGAKMDGG
jgi:NADH pyrophosphatase NudC (nudix superfamily)